MSFWKNYYNSQARRSNWLGAIKNFVFLEQPDDDNFIQLFIFCQLMLLHQHHLNVYTNFVCFIKYIHSFLNLYIIHYIALVLSLSTYSSTQSLRFTFYIYIFSPFFVSFSVLIYFPLFHSVHRFEEVQGDKRAEYDVITTSRWGLTPQLFANRGNIFFFVKLCVMSNNKQIDYLLRRFKQLFIFLNNIYIFQCY